MVAASGSGPLLSERLSKLSFSSLVLLKSSGIAAAVTCSNSSALSKTMLPAVSHTVKERAPKELPEETVENVASVIAAFPHFSGRKGQDYMLYHERGLIGEKAYGRVKKNVRRLLLEEAGRRELFGEKAYYEHVRPEKAGEIWAEDFTELVVEGRTFKAALLLDVFDQYYLGAAVGRRATACLVGQPVDQALEANGGRGPEKFLLSDNGSQ